MTSLNMLAELHALEFVARQRMLDEMSRDEDAKRADIRRAKASRLKNDWRQAAINSAGPMCLLDAVGQAEESWLEFFENAPRCDLPSFQDLAVAKLKPEAG